jgi:hypothetical protein
MSFNFSDEDGLLLGYLIIVFIIIITGFGIAYNLLSQTNYNYDSLIMENISCEGDDCYNFTSLNEELSNENILVCENILDENFKQLCYENYIDYNVLKISDCEFQNEELNELCLDNSLNILLEKYSDFNLSCSNSSDVLNCFNENSYSLIMNYENNNFECLDLDTSDKISDCEIVISSLIDRRENSIFYNFCPKLNYSKFREICTDDFERSII